jgi:hypothetical protein
MISARGLHSTGRRRGIPSPDWVKQPKTFCCTHTPLELKMTWTKPEAEVVAVTMEVTAYVATL